MLGDAGAGQAAGYLLLGLQRPDPGVVAEPQHVVAAVLAELQQVAAGVLGGGVSWPRDARHVRQPGQDRVAELGDERIEYLGGNLVQALLACGVPGLDHAAQRPLRPDRARLGLDGVFEVAQ